MRLIVYTMRAILILYFLVGILLYFFQRDLLYYPTPKEHYSFKKETFVNKEQSSNVIVLNQGQQKAVIYFGGNGEQVYYSADVLKEALPSYTVYLIDYRGYGWSNGTPTQEGIFSDAVYLYDQLKSRHKEIHLLGRSLGTGVASYLASQRDVIKMALVTPFDSILKVAQNYYPYYPVDMMLKDRYNSIGYLSEKSPVQVLIVMAGDDEVIPRQSTLNLYESLPKFKTKLKTIQEAGHNNISSISDYYETLREYFEN